MGEDDLLTDVETQTEALLDVFVLARPAVRFEDGRQQPGGDRPFVRDAQRDLAVRESVNHDRHRTILLAVPNGVADQIREDLSQAIEIPHPAHVARGFEHDVTLRVFRQQFVDDQSTEQREIHVSRLAWYPPARAHPAAGAQDSVELIDGELVGRSSKNQLGRGLDRGEGIPQIVAHDPGKQLIDANGVAELGDEVLSLLATQAPADSR